MLQVQYLDFCLLLVIYWVQDQTIKTAQNCKSHYLNAWQIYWWSKLVGRTSCYSYLLILRNRRFFSWSSETQKINAKTISAMQFFLIKKIFTRMDCCSAVSGGHNGVKKYFEESCSHNLYLHYRNQQIASFCHLIPKYNKFKQFDGLLLNVWLILKNSSVR